MRRLNYKNNPLYRQHEAQLLTGYGAITLTRKGDYAVVEIEAEPSVWIEIIREPLDSNFHHVIEPLGIEAEMRRRGFDPEAP